ncbi:MAG: hypothetical protein CUN57_01130 [Phototrophicales bacterium]|nr:MAG: hypothetical protein CUN57_01130 [Phototrophicales bacterium]
MVNPTSFDNAITKWWPEVTKNNPNTPIILVGIMLELRDDQKTLNQLLSQKKAPITTEQGMAAKKKIGALAYLECSFVTMKGIKEVLETVARTIITKCKEAGSMNE